MVIVHAGSLPGTFPGIEHSGQQEPGQNADNGHHYQEFNQREPRAIPLGHEHTFPHFAHRLPLLPFFQKAAANASVLPEKNFLHWEAIPQRGARH